MQALWDELEQVAGVTWPAKLDYQKFKVHQFGIQLVYKHMTGTIVNYCLFLATRSTEMHSVLRRCTTSLVSTLTANVLRCLWNIGRLEYIHETMLEHTVCDNLEHLEQVQRIASNSLAAVLHHG